MHYIVKFAHRGGEHKGWAHIETVDLERNSSLAIEILEVSGTGETANEAWADHYRKAGLLHEDEDVKPSA
jgi:hypothetical protein